MPHFILTSEVNVYKDIERHDSAVIGNGEIVGLVRAFPKKKTALYVDDSTYFNYISNKGNAYHYIDSVKTPVYEGPYYLVNDKIREFNSKHEKVRLFKSAFYRDRSARYQDNTVED